MCLAFPIFVKINDTLVKKSSNGNMGEGIMKHPFSSVWFHLFIAPCVILFIIPLVPNRLSKTENKKIIDPTAPQTATDGPPLNMY